MTNKIQLVVALMIGLATVVASADERISHQIGAFSSYQDTGGAEGADGAGLKYVFMLDEVAPKLDCGFDVRASWLVLDTDKLSGVDDLDIIPIEVTALARYSVCGRTELYGGLGLGYYFFDDGEDVVEYMNVDAETGFYGLSGIEVHITESVLLFLEVKYLWLEADIDGAAVDNNELDLSGYATGFGVAWTL